MSTLTYANNARIREIEEVYLPELREKSPLWPFFPDELDDADMLIWEQQDFIRGLQQWRGLDGAPPRVARLGINMLQALPGYYGEHLLIPETEITKRRRIGDFGAPIDITSVQIRLQKQLMIRRVQLIEKILCDLCVLGLYEVFDAKGSVVKAAGFTLRSYTAGVPWATFATATPLADFSAIALFERGFSANFGAAATAIMNRTTFNNLRQNTNQADLAGRRVGGLSGVNSLSQVNELFTGDALPNIVVYDKGYYDDNGAFQLYIPNNKVVVLAPRTTGSRIGAYRYTRNAVNPGAAPGSYSRVVDRGAMGQIPPTIEVHDGHNGGPIIEYPSSIAVMNV